MEWWCHGGARHPCFGVPSKSGSRVSVLVLVSCRLFVAAGFSQSPQTRTEFTRADQGNTTLNLLLSSRRSVAKRWTVARLSLVFHLSRSDSVCCLLNISSSFFCPLVGFQHGVVSQGTSGAWPVCQPKEHRVRLVSISIVTSRAIGAS
jgi:hypothetical protein